MKDLQLADDLARAFTKDSWNAPIVFDRDSNEWVGIQFFIEDCIKQGNAVFDPTFPLGQQYRRFVGVRGDPPAYTRTNRGTFNVSLEIMLDITRRRDRVSLKDHLQYSDDGKPLAYAAQGKLVSNGHEYYTIFVQRKSDDPTLLNVEIQAHQPELVPNQKYEVQVSPLNSQSEPPAAQ